MAKKTLQEYRKEKSILDNKYKIDRLLIMDSLRSSKADYKKQLDDLRLQSNLNEERVNHDGHVKQGAHNVCRFLTKALQDLHLDPKEFLFDPTKINLHFDIKNDSVVFQLEIKRIEYPF